LPKKKNPSDQNRASDLSLEITENPFIVLLNQMKASFSLLEAIREEQNSVFFPDPKNYSADSQSFIYKYFDEIFDKFSLLIDGEVGGAQSGLIINLNNDLGSVVESVLKIYQEVSSSRSVLNNYSIDIRETKRSLANLPEVFQGLFDQMKPEFKDISDLSSRIVEDVKALPSRAPFIQLFEDVQSINTSLDVILSTAREISEAIGPRFEEVLQAQCDHATTMKQAIDDLKTLIENEKKEKEALETQKLERLTESFPRALHALEQIHLRKSEKGKATESDIDPETMIEAWRLFNDNIGFEIPNIGTLLTRLYEAFDGGRGSLAPSLCSAEAYDLERFDLALRVRNGDPDMPRDYSEWALHCYRDAVDSYRHQLEADGLDAVDRQRRRQIQETIRDLRDFLLHFYDKERNHRELGIDLGAYRRALVPLLAVQGLELLEIEIGKTRADARLHDIQGTRLEDCAPGVVVEVISSGLRRLPGRALERKAVVIRGEPG